MKNLVRNCLVAVVLVFFTASLRAQQPLAAKPQASAPVEPAEQVDKLVSGYRFDEAAWLLQQQVEAAKAAGQPSVLLAEELTRVRLAASMLGGTEKVTFIDSLVLPKEDFLRAYRLSPGNGRLLLAKDFVAARGCSGATVYVNDLDDTAFLAMPDSAGGQKLCRTERLGQAWSEPQQLFSDKEDMEVQDYPFVMPDGVTLYFSAQGPESIGGYDIFVTRYDATAKRFLRPESVGMPFNSPANDYLLCIDEEAGVGCFVTDRRQPAGYVCAYYFIPSDVRDVYDFTQDDLPQLRRFAMLYSIAETQTDSLAAADVLARFRRIGQEPSSDRVEPFRLVVTDVFVCTDVQQLQSERARRIATQWLESNRKLSAEQIRLDDLRRRYAAGEAALRDEILAMEHEVQTLATSTATMERNIRSAEIQQMNTKH